MRQLLDFLILPAEITDFERRYLARLNRVALGFFALHVPAFMLLAWINGTRPLLAGALTLAALIGPALACFTLTNPRAVSVIHGSAAMLFGALLVHFGQGPVQIEMHFYFFALIAMLAVFGNPLAIIAAATTVALHHLIVWLVLPASVFNYDASWWVVAVHASFVVLESVAACFIARSFFDNVIGLEKIVQARTLALDGKNKEMRLLLDSVDQGFLTIDGSGALLPGRSLPVDRWFGAPAPVESWFDLLGRSSPRFAARTRLAWAEVAEGIMPLELTLDQMPRQLELDDTHLRVEYRPIGAAEPFDRFLVVISDVTVELARAQGERERREVVAVFERVLLDRSGFEMFFEEGSNVVDALTRGDGTDLSVVKRLVHTLKGNAALSGLASIAELCHALEDAIEESGALPTAAEVAPLAIRWASLAADVDRLMGHRAHTIEIDDEQYAALETAVRRAEPTATLLERVKRLRLEPSSKRLRHFAEQAQRISQRLEKGDVRIVVEDNGVRLDARRWGAFWSAFIHAVRNAVDHGLEAPEARLAAGKSEAGSLVLRTMEQRAGVVIEIADDGRGIDWAAIAERAERLGLPATTAAELTRALFAEGVTTAASVSDLSGRGVGMGALAHATRELGGELTVETKPGAGTTLRMVFPPQSTVPVPLAPAA
jgi:HPt (histidine-containing phosphotransfer) domain-containing protein